MPIPKKILIANRGEIAVRIIRACHELGSISVAVYSDADRHSLHVRNAMEAYYIGESIAADSYLNIERIIQTAVECGADAIHPGYGFLSENASFASAVKEAGLIWVGPSAFAIEVMGSKTKSRERMLKASVPVVPGTTEDIGTIEQARKVADAMGYPVMLKAAAGGGGKGMREVSKAADLQEAIERSRSEAASAFGDNTVYLEKRIIQPRHVEVQVLADMHGNVVHLFERDCSIQRRHQKVVEESPCPALSPSVRAKMTDVAVRAARSVDYVGAGTVEFLLDSSGAFYFLEMNTRLQVEHPITEMITGVDLVQAQLRIAGGEPLWFNQDDITVRGHAIECRIYAEDPTSNWAPSPGKITGYREPGGPWVRVDSGVYQGAEVSVYYDPMIAKLVVWGATRTEAIARTRRALREYRVRGINTSIGFFRGVVEDLDFQSGDYNTGFVDEKDMGLMTHQTQKPTAAIIAAAIAVFERSQDLTKPTEVVSETNRWRWSFRQ